MPTSTQASRQIQDLTSDELNALSKQVKVWGQELGFAQIGICDTDLGPEEAKFSEWLAQSYHGEMAYMANHGMMRARPKELHPGTLRVISARMNYLPPNAGFATNLKDPSLGYISRYAGGRDYHKMIRNRLKQLGQKLEAELKQLGVTAPNYRPFVDSAPVLERPLADKAGLGWTGKHSLLLNQEAGSWFFLGELFIDVPLNVDIPVKEGCNTCVACIKSCPTNAIVEPYVVDGRRCISYLTIEKQGSIPVEFREQIGNRIYGCDDCQLVCPINAQAPITHETDFHTRDKFIQPDLITLFNWSESEFLKLTEGSAIRRIGHKRWLRNIAIALGNGPQTVEAISALRIRRESEEVDEMVIEHIDWALNRLSVDADNPVFDKAKRKTARIVRAVEKGLPRDA